ncbi:zinc finger protein 845-like [Musca vetustissima]|uniref:zinc finger protein 845-like n=1 Tax=Musca vetustissima TaxID=27455 RepID=UPI002AB6C2C8|nr:zinc finger protein 845-like [Musca vetustissima]
MDVQIKHEVTCEDANQYPTHLVPGIQMTIKKEELIIDAEYQEDEDDKDCGYAVHHDNDGNFNEFSYDEDEDMSDYDNDTNTSESDDDPANEINPSHIPTTPMNMYKKIEILLNQNSIRIICPMCKVSVHRFGMWSKHINKYHSQIGEEIKLQYEYTAVRTATCTLCNETLVKQSTHYLHYLDCHSPKNKLLFVCKICKRRKITLSKIWDHIFENHKQIIVNFKRCPIAGCHLEFTEKLLLKLHFIDVHRSEYKTMLGYFHCPLCKHPKFDRESQYYDHLMNLHGLCDYNWSQLNFSRAGVGEGGQYECLECSQVYIDAGAHKLLEHYLSHHKEFIWFCKYCQGKFSYKDTMHFCRPMYVYFAGDEYKAEEEQASTGSVFSSSSLSVSSSLTTCVEQSAEWKAFESYISHICPYCGLDFNTFSSWQLHLRHIHFMNTLKGLRLSILVRNPKKFMCIDCNSLIDKTSRDIHLHRFLHLPHLPYKCRKCSKALGDLDTAIKHFQMQCDENDQKYNDVFHEIAIPKFSDDEQNWIEIFCSMCKKINFFANTEDINNHFSNSHNNFASQFNRNPNNIDMICKKCKTTIRSVSSEICLKHYIEHIDEGPYRCLMCQRSYKHLDICRRHLRRFHTIGKRMKRSLQDECDNTQEKALKIPKASKPKNKSAANSSTTTGPGGQPDIINTGLGTANKKAVTLYEFENFITFACPECNQPFDKQASWNEHIHKEHTFFNESELSDYDGSLGKYKCKHCNLQLDNSFSHRQKHKLTHMPYRSFVCTICDTRCNTMGLIYGHLRRNHFRKGTFECPICLVNLTTSYERSVHVNRTHPRSEWPANMCLICYRKYNSLSSHMASHDINRPKHVCPICGTSIVSIHDLKKHIIKKHNIEDPTEVLANGCNTVGGGGTSTTVKLEGEEEMHLNDTNK